MLATIILIVLIGLVFRFTPKIFLYALVTFGLAIQFVVKKIFVSMPWIISALVTVLFGLFALGRQFFGKEDAKLFAEKFLPLQKVPRETFSLTLIEFMILFHEKILSLCPRLKD